MMREWLKPNYLSAFQPMLSDEWISRMQICVYQQTDLMWWQLFGGKSSMVSDFIPIALNQYWPSGTYMVDISLHVCHFIPLWSVWDLLHLTSLQRSELLPRCHARGACDEYAIACLSQQFCRSPRDKAGGVWASLMNSTEAALAIQQW